MDDRIVQPEQLDALPPGNPAAVASRRDLQRLNRVMGSTALVRPAVQRALAGRGPHRVLDLGGGDGAFLLALARSLPGTTVQAVLVDRQPVVAPATREALAAGGWPVEIVAADAAEWLDRPGPDLDLILANLFFHHFDPEPLRALLAGAARRTRCLVALEPRRNRWALACSRLIGLIGCNAVTRHDAAVSVRAGFRDRDLTWLWPTDPGWLLTEERAGLFSHRFCARREGRS